MQTPGRVAGGVWTLVVDDGDVGDVGDVGAGERLRARERWRSDERFGRGWWVGNEGFGGEEAGVSSWGVWEVAQRVAGGAAHRERGEARWASDGD